MDFAFWSFWVLSFGLGTTFEALRFFVASLKDLPLHLRLHFCTTPP